MQVVEFGEGRIQQLEQVLNSEEPTRILLLRGNKSYEIFSQKINFMSKFIEVIKICKIELASFEIFQNSAMTCLFIITPETSFSMIIFVRF